MIQKRMKKALKIAIWILAVLILFFAALNIFLRVFGRAIIVSQIEKNLKAEVKLASLQIGLPLSITLNGLEIRGLIKADKISFSPSLLAMMAGKIVLGNLRVTKPRITILKESDGSFNFPIKPSGGQAPPILLTALKIDNGRLDFIDKKISSEDYRITVDKINVDIAKVMFPPASLYTNFDVSAVLLNMAGSPAGDISLLGWIDFGPKNMDGELKLENADFSSLAPYFKGAFAVKELLSARLNFNANLKAVNNDLTAKCRAEFITGTKQESVSSGSRAVSNILSLFSDRLGKINFDFTINTKLDNPRIDSLNVLGNIGHAAVESIANQSPEKVVERVKDTVEQFKDLGKGFKDVFKKKEE